MNCTYGTYLSMKVTVESLQLYHLKPNKKIEIKKNVDSVTFCFGLFSAVNRFTGASHASIKATDVCFLAGITDF